MPQACKIVNTRIIGREILAGLTTFFAMAYIVVVNPQVLSGADTGLSFSGVMTATVLVTAVASIAMGLFARLPFALAPGMGLNAFFTYSLVMGDGLSGRQALAAVTLSGIIFVLLSVTPARVMVARAFPTSLRKGASLGIGLFLAFLAFSHADVVVADPDTLVSAGPLTLTVALFFIGVLVTALLSKKNVPGALLIGILLVTGIAAAVGMVEMPRRLVSKPNWSLLFAADFNGIFTASLFAPLVTLLVTDLFDSISTLMGVSTSAGLVDSKGQPLRMDRALLVDAFATLASGLAGTSPATTYMESAAGIREGGKTGLTAVVVGVCFLPLLFVAPLAEMIPPVATAPALLMVSFYMVRAVGKVSDDLLELVPMLLTATLIPLTFSITQGIVWGVLTHLALQAFAGRARSVHPVLWGVGALCAVTLFAGAIG